MNDRRIHSIEGLRAIAVIAVIAFHLWPGIFSGGFLGVDLFFVISGYVITALLADQIRATGHLDFKSFYLGRARRLIPAIAVLVGVSLVLSAVFKETLNARALNDIPFIFTGTYNWHLSVGDVSYFDKWSPPLFQHLWSLAVETQFYMLWPIVLFALTLRWTSKQIALYLTLVSLGLSLWLMTGEAGYFTTQLHVISLFVGSALAMVWRREWLKPVISQGAQNLINQLGVSALLGLAYLLLFATENSGKNIYVLSAICGGMLLMAAVHPASKVRAFLTIPTLVAIGRRSYSLYLWHWPVHILTPEGPIYAPISILTTVVMSELSFRFIEEPFRLRNFKFTLPRIGLRLTPALPTAFLLLGITVATVLTPQSSPPAQGVVRVADSADWDESGDASSVPSPVNTPPEMKTSVFVGDSVLLGIRSQVPDNYNLRVFDAVVGRQAPELLAVLKKLSPELQQGLVVINFGNNGKISEGTTRWVFERLKTYKYSVIVNSHVPRTWQDPNNDLINQMLMRYPTVRLADWASASQGHPEYFGSDGVHLTLAGQRAYMATITNALK